MAHEGEFHFKATLEDIANWMIGDMMKMVRLYPLFFNQDDNDSLEAPVTRSELKRILEELQKQKLWVQMVGL
jgi:hypothetical protein